MEHDELCETVKTHEKRINRLEISDATIFERIDSLIKSQADLTGWVKALIVAIMISLAALFISNLI